MMGGILLLGERLTDQEWIGCGLIFAAVVLPLMVKRLRERQVGMSHFAPMVSRWNKGQ